MLANWHLALCRVLRQREGGSLAIIITCMGQAISDKPRCCALQMLCERLIVSKCCCRWRQLSDCLIPPGESMCEFGHDCCLLKSWLLSTWPMASQFVMCAINYKAEKGTPIAKPKRAMKCAVTSNNELAARSLSPHQSSTKPSHKSQAPWAGVCLCGCVGEYVCLPLCPASLSGKQPQSFIVVAGSSSSRAAAALAIK